MFNWSIELSANAVLMLLAFHHADAEKDGSQFKAAHAAIGDLWDIRAVRRLCEEGLLHVEHKERPDPNTAAPSIWQITEKGTLIALAIECDAEQLKELPGRNGLQQKYLATNNSPLTVPLTVPLARRR